MTTFTGLSAFPLTPVTDHHRGGIDEPAYVGLLTRLVDARVDSITALGSTGSYAYLDRDERRRAVRLAVQVAGSVPVLAGVGALRTRDVLRHAADAQAEGARGLLVAPMTYQPLTDDEVYDLFAEVTANADVPVVVYDNPGTTGFTFSDELHGRIAHLPGVASVKIPPVPGPVDVRQRVSALRELLPAHVTLGISGDPFAATALLAGCQAWYGALAGTLPAPCRAIVDAVAAGDAERAISISDRLAPLWALFAAHGSLRVIAALAEELGLVSRPHLPRPVQGLPARPRDELRVLLPHLTEHP